MATTLGPWDNVVNLASFTSTIATGISIATQHGEALALPMTRTELIPTHLIPTMLFMIGKGLAPIPGIASIKVAQPMIDLFKWISFFQSQ